MNNFNVKQFFYFDELSSEAKQQARINVMIPEIEAHKNRLAIAAEVWKANPHKAINDPMHIKCLINVSEALRKVKLQGDKYLLAYIRQNCTIFTDKGDYVYYVTRCCEIVSQGKHYKLDSDEVKQLAIQAYIDVNARGPAYHRELYRMWDHVKHFMIR